VFTVLVVCTGNLNRSALGALLLDTWAHWYLPAPLTAHVRVTSAGLRAPVGSPMARRSRVIAEALGADGSAHVARQITEETVRSADLVLVASRRQRDDVIALVPAALRSTFTIREAGRIAETLPDLGAPVSAEELRARVAAIAERRSAVRGGDDEDDIIDPQGKDDGAFLQMAREEVPSLTRIAGVLFDMPQAEREAYVAAAEAGDFSFSAERGESPSDGRSRPRGRREA
jgi:protein-tyrosine phosphatase